MALAIVKFFSGGPTYIASRIGVEHMPGFFVSGVRQFSSGVILASFFLLKGYKLPAWNELKKISLQGIILLCIANGFINMVTAIYKQPACSNYCSIGSDYLLHCLVCGFQKCAKITRWNVILVYYWLCWRAYYIL